MVHKVALYQMIILWFSSSKNWLERDASEDMKTAKAPRVVIKPYLPIDLFNDTENSQYSNDSPGRMGWVDIGISNPFICDELIA